MPSLVRPPSRFWTDYYGAIYLLFLGIFFGCAMTFLRPAIFAFRETNQLVESKIGDIQKRTDYLNALDRSIVAAQSIDEKTLGRIARTLPSEPRIPLLLLQLGSAATRHGLKATAISFAQIKSANGKNATATVAVPVDISLTLQGRTYADLKRFLADVESSARLLDVTGISASGKPGEYSYAIQLRTYVYPEATSTHP
jgi:Tfp pilus assembly protein PilO